MEMLELKSFFANKKVFLTGHTGFKGAWLALLLKELGATVCAYSLAPENIRGNLFLEANIESQIESHIGDICDLPMLQNIMHSFQPDIVLHLAAQAIVLTGYQAPVQTFMSNVQGTVHVLECVRQLHSCKAVLCITTDKCYENKEWHWSYRENDSLGGNDPYSASKAMAELAVNAYRKSYFTEQNRACASVRAGNVIGGGDYAAFRIMPDIAQSIAKNEQIILRNPLSIRPWQHVLDALYGYLILTKKMYENPKKYSKAYNFAPYRDENTYTVQKVTELYLKSLDLSLDNYTIQTNKDYKPEATLLQLDPSLAYNELNWNAKLSVPMAVKLTATWFNTVQEDSSQANTITQKQIQDYFDKWK